MTRGTLTTGRNTPTLPPRRKRATRNRWQKHYYLELHTDQIIADVRALGRAAAARKWNVAHSTVLNILNRYLTPHERMLIPYMKPGRKC